MAALGNQSMSIVLLGETGNGKSLLGNELTGRSHFEVGHGVESQTKYVQSSTVNYAGITTTVYDTPGFNDQQDSDETHMVSIREQLSRITDCTSFFLVLNAADPRYTESMHNMIRYLKDVFQDKFVSNFAVVATHCGPPEYRNERSLDSWKRSMETKLQQALDTNSTLRFFYVDSKKNMEETKLEEMRAILEYAKSKRAFGLTDIEFKPRSTPNDTPEVVGWRPGIEDTIGNFAMNILIKFVSAVISNVIATKCVVQ
jgi:predicted GTPase